MKEIELNRNEVIEKYIDNVINQEMQTGGRREFELHIFNGDQAKVRSHQDGNSYDSKIDVDVLNLEELFEKTSINEIPSFNDDYSESRKEFMENYGLETMDELDEKQQEKYDELLLAYMSNSMDIAKAILSAGMKTFVKSENAEGSIVVYKINWV